MAAALPIIGQVLSTAATVVPGVLSYVGSQKQTELMQQQADKQEQEQRRLLNEAQTRASQEEAIKRRDMTRARQRQEGISRQAANKGGTVLANPFANPGLFTTPIGGTSLLGG